MSRKDLILEAAIKIAEKQGIDCVSVRHVAEEAGVGASTLRYYFPTTRDLIDEVTAKMMGELLADLQITDTTIPAVTRLTECLEQFLPPTIHATETLQGLIAGFAFCFKDGELVGDPKIHDIMTAGEQKIETWLSELQAQGVELNMGLSQAVQLLKNQVNGVSINLIGKAPSYSMKDAHAALHTAATLVIKEKQNRLAKN